MRVAVLFVSVALVAGCARSTPFHGVVPAPQNALSCALAEATQRSYAVQSAEEGVFFRAERRRAASAMRVVNRWDVLTAAMAEGQLSVTMDGLQQELTPGSEPREPIAPSDAAIADGKAILRSCSSL